MELTGETLLPGSAQGPVLKLRAPISFWGGVDPASGRIIDVRHPDHGRNISGTVLALPGTIGSSSSSSVMLELVHRGRAPAALILAAPDAILLLGLVVAVEMGWPGPPALRLDPAAFTCLPDGAAATVEPGRIFWDGPPEARLPVLPASD